MPATTRKYTPHQLGYFAACLLCGCLAWCLTPLAAQPLNLRFEHITIEDGISDLRVSAILQDRQGYMWFGTHNGLNRYDGYEFQTYWHKPADTTSIAGNSIEELYEDSRGDIWIGLYSTAEDAAGLCRYDPQTGLFTRYAPDPNDPNSIGLTAVSSIIETRDGYLWFASWQGLDRLDPTTGIFKHFRHDPDDPTSLSEHSSIFELYEDRKGALWIGSGLFNNPTEGGLNRYHPETETFTRYLHDPDDPHSLRSNVVMALFEDSRGNFWVGTQGDGLHLMDREQGTFTHFPYDPTDEEQLSGPNDQRMPTVNFIREDPLGRLWIGGGGLVVYDLKTEQVSRFKSEAGNPNSPGSFFIWKMALDRSGNVWLSDGSTAFLDKVSLQPLIFKEYLPNAADPNSIRGRDINAIVPGENDNLWIATSEGINLYDPERKELKFFKPATGALYTICREGKDAIWYGGWETGLYRYDLQTGQELHFPYLSGDSTHSNLSIISSILFTSSGDLWVTSFGQGLFRYEREDATFRSYKNEGFLSIDNLYEERSGQLWAGAAEGLFRYDRQTDRLEQVLSTDVNSILESSNGDFWISTDGEGLWRYDRESGQVETFTVADGLASNAVYHLAEDRAGNLWLGTGKKISKFQPATGSFTNYDAKDGISNIFNFNYWSADAVAYAKNGDLFFGGGKGLTRISTRDREQIQYPPQVRITRVQSREKDLSLVDKSLPALKFSHDQNELIFEYVGLHYTDPARNQYQYILENADPDWIPAGTERRARYTNLDPGRYTFRVKAAGSDGIWSEEAATVNLIILPPWWQTWWAYLLYLLLGTLAVYTVYRYQKRRLLLQASLQIEQAEARRLKELDEFKSRFYANITHEFRTPLTVIQGLAREVKENPRWKIGERTDMINRNSGKLLQLINQMLDLSKLEAGKLEPEYVQGDIIKYLSYMVESFHSLAYNQNVTLSFHSQTEGLLMDYDPGKCRQIFGNLIANAIKFTSEYGSVKVVAKVLAEKAGPDQLEIEVKDTGQGIPAEQLPFIFDRFYQVDDSSVRQEEGTGLGLSLAKELLTLMGGSIQVQSEVGRGSTFTCRLPVRNEAVLATADPVLPPVAAGRSNAFAATDDGLKSGAKADLPLVLVVEDNRDVIYYLRDCLVGRYRIHEAKNGREGLARAFEHIPDLVISDVMMPEMGGFELCRTLKTDERTSHIPVVLLTAKATQTDKMEGLRHGADVYLSKPFQKEELLLRLDNLLVLRRQLQRKYQSADGPATELEDPFLQKARQLIEDHLDDPGFGVMPLSRALGMSRVQVHRKLKALTGFSASQYLRTIRLQRAYELLKDTELTIAEVSYQVGYKDPAHFSRSFSQHFGLAPREMRG